MKANFIGAVIVCALAVVQGSEYVYLDGNNQSCIVVKMDVTFTLSNGTGSVILDGNNFTVISGDCASATEDIASMLLQNSNEDILTLTFLKADNRAVSMSFVFAVSPSYYFPGVPTPNSVNLNDQGDLVMGNDTQLYECNSPQKITLTGDLEGVTYSLVLDMSNTQIQAFNIQGGNLSSDVFVCSADQMTTSVIISTESNSTTPTTGASTQPTTEPPPTTTDIPTPPTPLGKSTYRVMEGSEACLIMEGSFQLSVTYMKKDNSSGSGIVNVPESKNVNVTGKCASVNDTTSQLTITAKDEAIKSMTFNFEIVNDKSRLVSWSAEVSLNSKSFPDAKEDELNHIVNEPINFSDAKVYYKCDTGETFKDGTLGFIVKQFRVQAFNVESGKFSDNGADCKEDVGPVPMTIPNNTFTFTEANNTCIVFKGRIQFSIPYVSKRGNVSELISVPSEFNVTGGSCSTTLNGYLSQNIEITFYDSWNLTIFFSSDGKETELLTAPTKPTKYFISQIQLDYDYNSNLFIDIEDSMVGEKKSVVATNLTMLTTSKDKSYMCNKATTFDLHDGLSMAVTDFQYQAFKDGNTTQFGDANECTGDEDTNNIVPIAVGASLAGLVIIVLIVYLIGRKRDQLHEDSGYEPA
ncbi:lysosome-associated membrane glycoprotein 1-like [Ostrea edulis]|uniref:lysosome-associated membrane glycoprotein 1-like n=1 Tax=Ostrea edulis TaxID=37623 RepID=UPI0024AEDC7E|nr:lysosome-associated membrane glycoprotein 1-like [Ostrea edulis]